MPEPGTATPSGTSTPVAPRTRASPTKRALGPLTREGDEQGPGTREPRIGHHVGDLRVGADEPAADVPRDADSDRAIMPVPERPQLLAGNGAIVELDRARSANS